MAEDKTPRQVTRDPQAVPPKAEQPKTEAAGEAETTKPAFAKPPIGDHQAGQIEAKGQEIAGLAGLDWAQARKGLERLLKVVGPVAALTPWPYDDIAVAFIEALLARNPA